MNQDWPRKSRCLPKVTVIKGNTLWSSQNSVTSMTFPSFMTKVKQLCSQEYHKNIYLTYFPALRMRKFRDCTVSILSFCLLFSESILLFHDFPWPTLQFHYFSGLEIEIINSMTFQVFHDLDEPWCLLESFLSKRKPRKIVKIN